MNEMDYARQRDFMVLEQLEARGVSDENVLEAMGRVKRELFVPEDIRTFAYHDGPLPIDCGQTISQPYIIAVMAEFLNLSSEDRVLEIGTGSGYNAAILSQIVDQVYTIEIHSTLAQDAEALFNELEYKNIEVRQANGLLGWKEKAPFDAILVSAASTNEPSKLLDQLADPGRLIIPEGIQNQFLFLYEKRDGKIDKTMLMPVKFSMLEGEASTDQSNASPSP